MAEPKFVIQGVDYPVPAAESMTIGEARILSQMTRVDPSKVINGEAAFDMDVVAALMVIAYLRGNPGVSRTAAEAIVDSIPILDLNDAADAATAGDVSPPAPAPSETAPPAGPESSAASQRSSGDGSESASDSSAVFQLPTGQPVSATPPASDPRTLAN